MSIYGNTFGRSLGTYGGGKRIWHDIFHSFPVGGVVSNLSSFANGAVIPAGSLAIYELGSVEIVTLPNEFVTTKSYSVNAEVIKDGVLYKASSAVSAGNWDSSKWTALAAGDDTYDKAVKVNGLTHNDIYLDDNASQATANVVYAGVVYESRLDTPIPTIVKANLPQIKTIKEA